MINNSRRSFLRSLAMLVAAGAIAPTLEIDKLLWIPNKKTIFVPPIRNVMSGWSAEDVALYNRLPFYLAKMQIDRRQSWAAWEQLVTKHQQPLRTFKLNRLSMLRPSRGEQTPQFLFADGKQTFNPLLDNLI